MAAVRKQKATETIFDKSLPSKAKPEVSLLIFNLLFNPLWKFNN